MTIQNHLIQKKKSKSKQKLKIWIMCLDQASIACVSSNDFNWLNRQQHHHIKRLLPKSKRTIRASKQIMAHLATKTKGIMRKVVTLLGWSSPLTLMGWSGLIISKDLVESNALLGWSIPMMMKEMKRSFPMMNGILLLDLAESTLTILSKSQNQLK